MNPNKEAIFFSGRVLSVGDSLMVTIPKANTEYLGIKEGDEVRARIVKIQHGVKK
jgi:antitoxin component of MazEF toxin-antitoxin module